VPLTLSDVLSPAGDIDGSVWFPGLDSTAVNTLVTGYVTDAEGRSDDEDAQLLWVYYRAATAVADRLGGSGGGTRTLQLVDQGSKTETTSPGQLDYWERKAAAYLAAYEDLVSDVVDDPLGGFSVLTSLRHG